VSSIFIAWIFTLSKSRYKKSAIDFHKSPFVSSFFIVFSISTFDASIASKASPFSWIWAEHSPLAESNMTLNDWRMASSRPSCSDFSFARASSAFCFYYNALKATASALTRPSLDSPLLSIFSIIEARSLLHFSAIS
jgi:hypothetical protein